MSDKCEKCGAELQIGSWPYCKGKPDDHAPAQRFGYDSFSAYFDEHIRPGGAYITTRAERMKIMRERKLEYKKQPKPAGKTLYFL